MAIGRIPEPGTGIPESIIAAKGDLIVGTANDVPGILTVGTDGHTLVADSVETTGLKWVAPATNPITTEGDLVIGDASGDAVRLPIGALGTVLTSDGDTADWAAPAGANPSFALLSTTTLTGAATFTISSLSGYNTFYIIVKNSSTGSASDQMRYRINANTGNVYRSYGVTIDPGASYSSSIATQNVIETTSLSLGSMSSNAGSQVSGFIRLEGCNSSGIKMIHSACGVGPEGGSAGANRIVGGFIEDSNVVSSITFFSADSSNFDVGTLRIYGSVA